MSKYQTFEDLQALGSEKIHEKTHISRDKLELLLAKSYDKIGRVQFMGFLSILEREYDINLNDTREEYDMYRDKHADLIIPKKSVILQAPSNAKQKWVVAAAAAIAILLGGGYVLQSFLSNEPSEDVMKLSSLAVEAIIEPAEANVSAETNVTSETNQTVTGTELNTTNPALAGAQPLNSTTILPKYKVWVGIIDMSTGAKTQKITGEPIVVDTSKNWLIVLGHGMVEINSKSGQQLLKEKNTVHLSIENGSIRQISQSEFLERNGGKNW